MQACFLESSENIVLRVIVNQVSRIDLLLQLQLFLRRTNFACSKGRELITWQIQIEWALNLNIRILCVLMIESHELIVEDACVHLLLLLKSRGLPMIPHEFIQVIYIQPVNL